MKSETRGKQMHAEFEAERHSYFGGSDAASVAGTGRYGCKKRVVLDKRGVPKDYDDSDRMEFRRGHRLEPVAAAYYAEKTGREVAYTTRQFIPGKPYLSINADRLVYKTEDKTKQNPGYLELKCVGRNSWFKIKKEGVIDDYLLQTQWGMAVMGASWGAFGIYCADLDELMVWDFEADKELGMRLMEMGEDLWTLGVECGVIPEPLPEDSPQCNGCPWEVTCRGKTSQVASGETISRPDLESLAAKHRELKGMASEAGDAADSVRAEIIEAIRGVAGVYQFGKYPATFTVAEQKRFNGALLKKKDPALYESLREISVTETLRIRESV